MPKKMLINTVKPSLGLNGTPWLVPADKQLRWALAGAAKPSSSFKAAAPARCMAERTAISTASRSRRPVLRRPWKMICKS